MGPEEIQAVAAASQTLIALVTLIVTVALTLLLYFTTKKISVLEYTRAMREAWSELDITVLSNDEILKTADLLVDPDSAQDSLETRRKKWFGYMLLNALVTVHQGMRNGLVDATDGKHLLETYLKRVLADNHIFKITQTQGYEPSFAALCKYIRKQEEASNHTLRFKYQRGVTSTVSDFRTTAKRR